MSGVFNSHLIMIVVVAVTAIIGIISIKYLGQDNPVEEIAEKVIKAETGIDIDLSPNVAPSTATTKPDITTPPSQSPAAAQTESSSPK